MILFLYTYIPCAIADRLILEKPQHFIRHHDLMEFCFLFIRKIDIRDPDFLHISSIKVNVVKVVDVCFVEETVVRPLEMDD